MIRRSHLFGAASVNALALLLASSALSQQSLPTIDIGGARRAPAVARPGPSAPGPARIAAPAPVTAPASGADRYAEPKPAPFSRTLPQNIPAVVESRTRAEIFKTTNVVTSADAFRYLPSIFVRERYPGDRNGIVSGRTTGTIEGAMNLVYADNILLSNLLGNSFNNAPRWGMVSPAEISRIDVIYGPFSALYPGNSIGGVLTMTTRMPDNFEVHAYGNGFVQPFSLYGRSETNLGGVMNVLVGNRVNDLRYWVGYEYLDNSSQMQFFRGGTPLFPAAPGAGVPFSGGYLTLNQEGRPTIITGGDSAERVQQHLAKFKVSYDLAQNVRLKYQVGLWNLNSDSTAQTFIYDRNGVPIYNTASAYGNRLQFGNLAVASGAMNPAHGGATHLMQSLELKRDTGGVLDYDLSLSSYNFLRDFNNSAQAFGLVPNVTSTAYTYDPRGVATNNGGTYWRTVDARIVLRPEEELLKNHEFSLGAHGDQYGLATTQTSSFVWPGNTPIAPTQVNYGRTQTVGMYMQDAWRFLPDWKLTAGLRAEQWRANGGFNANMRVSSTGPFAYTFGRAGGVLYPDSSKNALSPKAALEWRATPELTFRGSVARAYRFPTVSELFQTLDSVNSISINNPGLQPVVCTCYDFTTEYRWVNAFNGSIGLFVPRVSFFLDERWNAIVGQRQLNASGAFVNSNVNVDRARFRGIEIAADMRDVFIPGFDIQGGVTFTDAKILNNLSGGFNANRASPVLNGGSLADTVPPAFFAGNQYPRVPRIRIRGVASYTPNPDMSFSLGMRYASGAFVSLANTDFNHNDYGNVDSEYLFIDAKARYRVAPHWWASVGINNIGRWKAYVNPNPYPQRTFFMSLNYDLGGPEDGVLGSGSSNVGRSNPATSGGGFF